MKRSIVRLLDSIAKKVGARTLSRDALTTMAANASAAKKIDLLIALPAQHTAELLKLLRHSPSQLGQDLFVLSQLGFKRNGFFVEFGATNGLDLSNTHLLEKQFGWRGILAEPDRRWHQALSNNRSADIEHDCVYVESNRSVSFGEVKAAELSTISSFASSDLHGRRRRKATQRDVNTISLNDLLEKYQAPYDIDYLSIDTEGSEFDILNAFDFSRNRIAIITCEHNHTPAREKIYALLSRNGYSRTLESLSKFDDWFVKTEPRR